VKSSANCSAGRSIWSCRERCETRTCAPTSSVQSNPSIRRDARSFLWDVREAADAIQGFVQGCGVNDYTTDLLLRSAVERQFQIIGEALSQLAKIDATPAARIPDLRRIVGFRNFLIHGYDRSTMPRCGA
jgi:uncharacterized protein with HEPN domain